MRIVIGFSLILTLAACESRLNPMNWFGGPREERIRVEQVEVMVDPRGLVDQVTDLRVDATSTGAIVTATGLPARQGFWAAELVEIGREDGTITYAFRIAEPPGTTPSGSAAARSVVVATGLSQRELAEIRTVVVEGARNRLSVRR